LKEVKKMKSYLMKSLGEFREMDIEALRKTTLVGVTKAGLNGNSHYYGLLQRREA
jgi:hypothetical protein